MPFDVEKARKAGYSEDQILEYLSQGRRFDVPGALKAGHSKKDVISYLASTPKEPETSFDRMKRVHQEAEQRLFGSASKTSTEQFKKAQESAQQDIGRSIGKAAETVPFGAAAFLTGGTSVPVGTAIMGGAGLASGLLREGSERYIGGIKKPLSEIGLSLGVDTVTGMALEYAPRTAGKFVKSLFPKMLMTSAYRAEAGKKLIDDAYVATKRELWGLTGNTHVDITGELAKAENGIATIPHTPGDPLAERFGNLSPKAQEAMKALRAKLSVSSGGSAQMRLDQLIQTRGDINQFAFKELEIGAEEAKVFQDLSKDLDTAIRAATKSISPEAAALYEQSNKYMTIRMQKDITTTFARRFMQSYARHAIYAGVGGYAGYRSGGGYKGAVAGAAAGTALDIAAPKISSWMLDQVMKDKVAARFMKNAVSLFTQGKRGEATAAASRAFAQAGVGPKIKEAFSDPAVVAEITGSQPPQ